MMEMRQTPTVRELGVEVTYEMVARAALLRGLKTFKSKESPKGTPKLEVVENTEPSPKPDTKKSLKSTKVVRVGEEILPPSGWQKWHANERVPPGQEDCHGYYERNGWARFWGDTVGETISFYWCPVESKQSDLEPFPIAGPSGKKVLIQETPWGPGHMVPHGW
tara:strand:- start:1237 stop:1728 length:492 start_codon:yes stop_codon:yes gene_type:complete